MNVDSPVCADCKASFIEEERTAKVGVPILCLGEGSGTASTGPTNGEAGGDGMRGADRAAVLLLTGPLAEWGERGEWVAPGACAPPNSPLPVEDGRCVGEEDDEEEGEEAPDVLLVTTTLGDNNTGGGDSWFVPGGLAREDTVLGGGGGTRRAGWSRDLTEGNGELDGTKLGEGDGGADSWFVVPCSGSCFAREEEDSVLVGGGGGTWRGWSGRDVIEGNEEEDDTELGDDGGGGDSWFLPGSFWAREEDTVPAGDGILTWRSRELTEGNNGEEEEDTKLGDDAG